MVYAHAKSVRDEKSKHRYALQEFGYVRITLVRGKSGWRITGSEPIRNFFSETTSREQRAVLRKLFLFLRRVLQGETIYSEIFDDSVDALKELSAYHLDKLDVVLSLRTLYRLGYVAPNKQEAHLLQEILTPILVNTMDENTEKKSKEVIEYALIQSQL
jgi:recombinational DNA repair protein (RecF pathway)